MIAYGYEQPVAITPTEIFNPTTANMVLQSMGTYANALREDYKDTVAKLEEFMKEYGLFTSPIEKDAEYFYNNTIGGLGRLFDEADKQGVDLLRSQQGRAIIQRYIMSRPYGDLSNIRESAINAKEYIKNRDDLKSKGLYSKNMEDWENPISIENWSTKDNGSWSKVSPNQYQTIDQMVKPIVDELQASPSHLRDEGYYSYYGVSDDRINDSLNANLEDLLAKPSMLYILNTMGGDKERLKQELFQRVKSKIPEKRETNDVKFKLADLSIKQQELAIKQAEAAADIALKLAKAKEEASKGLNADGTYNYGVVSFNTAMEYRGYRGQYYTDPDGNMQYATPTEIELDALQRYMQSKLAEHVVYDKDLKRNVKLKDLPEGKRNATINAMQKKGRLTELEAQYKKEFYRRDQAGKVASYVKTNKDYWSRGSLAFASPDDGEQWMSLFGTHLIYYDDDKKPRGIKTDTNRMKNSLLDISEVTQRSGAVSKMDPYKKYQTRFNDVRNRIAYIDAPNDGRGQDQIVQWEPRVGTYIKYRRVVAYDENDNPVATMWFDCGDPRDVTSTLANGVDQRATKAAGGSTKAIESSLNTVD